jgi:predicted DNA-binding ribbon-helix-helix protein
MLNADVLMSFHLEFSISLRIDIMTSLRNDKMMSAKPAKKKVKRKNTSLRLDEAVLKKLKIYAVKKDTSVQQIIEDLVEGFLKNKK